MTKVCIFIPSHINYNGQIDLLYSCLESLISQTNIPDIYISISFGNDTYKKEFTEKILRNFPKPKYLFSKQKLFQMEHIYKLTKNYANNYELIMFCDDDDTYNKNRVQKIVEAYQYGKKYYLGYKIAGFRECIKIPNTELNIGLML